MPRQVPTPRTVEIPSAEAVAKERERLQYKKQRPGCGFCVKT